MIDCHTHSIFSDGELIPSELVRRAAVAGYRAIAITDHGDHSNIDFVIPRLVNVCKKLAAVSGIVVLPGIELTHVPPVYIAELVREARGLGAKLVLVHGESIAEPVPPGTNLAALKSSVDILAHPGLLSEEEASLAARAGIFCEITTRKGHSLTNGHVASMARKFNFPLIMNTDSHAPEDLTPLDRIKKIALGAGMTDAEIAAMFANSESLVKRLS